MIAWWRRRNAAALLRSEGLDEVHVDASGAVLARREGGRDPKRSPPIRIEHRVDDRPARWRLIIDDVGGAPRLLHPSSLPVEDDVARAALGGVIGHAPFEVELVGGALSASFVEPPSRWEALLDALVTLWVALRALRTTSLTCPACIETPLSSRAGLATCSSCQGRLVTGDLARERIFDPRGLDPGSLKDAGIGKGLVPRCPACAHPMAPVLIDALVVDVCKGCGALWCDEGELAALGSGMAPA